MQKQNLSKTIIIPTFLIAFTLITGLLIYGHSETKKAKNLPVDFIEPVKPVENNDSQELWPEIEPIEPVEMETYKGEFFIGAKWGEGKGEVGIYRTAGDEGGEGPSYGPQSFDINGETDHLFLLDSANSRVIEYDENGKYLKDFPISCGGTGDIKISPDYKYLYVWSGRCGAIYKYDIGGEFVEKYQGVLKKNPGIGTGGIAFDENGNVMLDIRIRDYDEETRFYQIGKNGDKWKENNFIGYPLNSKNEYCLVRGLKKGETWTERHLVISDKNDNTKREIKIKLPRDGFVYFVGSDKNDNIYLEVQYSEGSGNIEVRKYNKRGGLLAVIDAKEMPRINNFIYYYTRMFDDYQVSQNGDIYLMFSDTEEIKIYKYSVDKILATMGYIQNVYERKGKRYLDIDHVQWLMHSDGSCSLTYEAEEVAAELSDVPKCNPNGFLVVKKDMETETFEILEDVEIIMCSYGGYIEWDQHIEYKDFKNIFKENDEDPHHYRKIIPFIIETDKDNKIITIMEQYIP